MAKIIFSGFHHESRIAAAHSSLWISGRTWEYRELSLYFPLLSKCVRCLMLVVEEGTDKIHHECDRHLNLIAHNLTHQNVLG